MRLTSLTIHVKGVPRIAGNKQFILQHIAIGFTLNCQTFCLYLWKLVDASESIAESLVSEIQIGMLLPFIIIQLSDFLPLLSPLDSEIILY